MLDLPELTVIAAQMNDVMTGKVVAAGRLGNAGEERGQSGEEARSVRPAPGEPQRGRRAAEPRPAPHRFVWYDHDSEAFGRMTADLTTGAAWAEGKWLFLPLEPSRVLLLGEWGGRIRYLGPDQALPPKYHVWLQFTDGSSLLALTQMWGGCHLVEAGHEHEVKYVAGMRPSPVDPAFDWRYFRGLTAEAQQQGKRSVKGLLTQEGLIPGLGNALAQDMMFRARLHPKRGLETLGDQELRGLYSAITETIREVIAAGGRSDEHDLFDRPGGYRRIMDAKAVGRPCPACATPIVKISYLGGACYFCPVCQR